jgi:hypothetical protein
MKGATAAMAVKTDRNDARAMAQAIRVGWFTAVHVKTTASFSGWRSIPGMAPAISQLD